MPRDFHQRGERNLVQSGIRLPARRAQKIRQPEIERERRAGRLVRTGKFELVCPEVKAALEWHPPAAALRQQVQQLLRPATGE